MTAEPHLEVSPAADRYDGGDRATGIDTRHAFSFAGFYDPANVRFGLLLACNEERLAPGAGFAEHTHRDTEIVTWVIDGELEHVAADGTSTRLPPGGAQLLSAGTGVRHIERNAAPATAATHRTDTAPANDAPATAIPADAAGAATGPTAGATTPATVGFPATARTPGADGADGADDGTAAAGRPGGGPVRFLQMWLHPEPCGGPPRYRAEPRPVPDGPGLHLLASADPAAPLPLRQPHAALYVARGPVRLPDARFLYVHVLRGAVRVLDAGLGPGDALRGTNTRGLAAEADPSARYLVWRMDAEPRYG